MALQPWQPSASIERLRKRADLMRRLRLFFQSRNVLEVDVPLLGKHSVTDPFIDAFPVQSVTSPAHYFLQTSPEYFMKRLLSAGMSDIFYLGKAFRDDPITPKHNPEFTMLEWYRIGMSSDTLIDEVFELVDEVFELVDEVCAWSSCLKDTLGAAHVKKSYGQVFTEQTGINPYLASEAELAAYADKHMDLNFEEGSKNFWLDLIFSQQIEPCLKGLVCIYDYPKEQCALAKVEKNAQGQPVAKRFEFFINGVELANGYQELMNADILRERFEQDNGLRLDNGRSQIETDESFLAAMQSGSPECAGVDLGVDRLMMALLGEPHIKSVLPFSDAHL